MREPAAPGPMVDAHAHLDRYGEDLPRALDQIRRSSVRTLAVSMDPASFRKTSRIAEGEPLIFPSFGVHPWEAHRFASDLEALEAPLSRAPLIGEIGLDQHFVKDADRYPAQRVVLEFLLEAAEASGRLVNLHTTGAESEVLDALRSRALPAIVVHWYSGPPELVAEFLDLGAFFTVGVAVLRSKRARELATSLPDDRLLTETDNPGGWKWMTGEVGFPDLLERVRRALAELRGVPLPELDRRVAENFERVTGAGGVEL